MDKLFESIEFDINRYREVDKSEIFSANRNRLESIEFNGKGIIFPTNLLYNENSYIFNGRSYLIRFDGDDYILFDCFLKKKFTIIYDTLGDKIVKIKLNGLIIVQIPSSIKFRFESILKYHSEYKVEAAPIIDFMFERINLGLTKIKNANGTMFYNLIKNEEKIFELVNHGIPLNNFLLYSMIRLSLSKNFSKNILKMIDFEKRFNHFYEDRKKYILGESDTINSLIINLL